MAKQYLVLFGSGNPASNTGLSPTFTVFKTVPGGTNATPPGITEIPSATGQYYFTYGATNAIAFVIDGGSGLASSIRYVPGLLDPVDAIDEQLTAYGNTALQGMSNLGTTMLTSFAGLGNTMFYGFSGIDAKLGATNASFGSTNTDPTSIFGFVKRLQEFNEGNSTFNKATGVWDVYSRGSSTLLTEKTLADSSGTVSKT